MVWSSAFLCFWCGPLGDLALHSVLVQSKMPNEHLVGSMLFWYQNGGERWLSRLPRARCPWLRLLVIEREAATVDDRRQAAARPFMGPPQCSFFECPGWLSFLYCTQLTAHSWWPPRLRRAKRWSGSRPKRGLWGFRVGRVKRAQQG